MADLGAESGADPRDGRETLTPREVEGLLEIPPSTLRGYASRFAGFLSPGAEGGARPGSRGFGHRRYTAADVAILTQIKALLDRGLSYDLVGAELGELPRPRRIARRRDRSEPGRRALTGARGMTKDVSASTRISIVKEEQSATTAEPLTLPTIDPEQIARAIVGFLPRSNDGELLNRLDVQERACADQGRRLAALSVAVTHLTHTLDQIVALLETMDEDRRERSRPGWLRRLLHLG